MGKKLRIVAILPAYNAAASLGSFLNEFPFSVFDEVILVDDCSSDNTFVQAQKEERLKVFRTLRNLGYGGNLKYCLGIALGRGADVIVEIHPDGEYGFDGISPAIEEVKNGAKFVLGNRFGKGRPQGMLSWKIPFTNLLTRMANLVFSIDIPDLHQGFRIYTQEFLKQVNYKNCSNNYIFSFEIIAQAVIRRIKISSVFVSVNYQGKKRGASLSASIKYFWGVMRVLEEFGLAKVGWRSRLFSHPILTSECIICQNNFLVAHLLKIKQFNLYFCKQCLIGFVRPVPKNIGIFYKGEYWNDKSWIGIIKSWLFTRFQRRRVNWIKQIFPERGKILDVGSGEGRFGDSLGKEYRVVSLEPAFSKVKNKKVLKVDFLKYQTSKKFDAITFWESLEHVSDPSAYLKKASNLLKKNGYVLVEYPNSVSLEAKLFKENWFHLDIPRHLSHLTSTGLELTANKTGLKLTDNRNVLALEYGPAGLFFSILRSIGLIKNHVKLTTGDKYLILILSPILAICFILVLVFYTIRQSPISLATLKKDNEL